MSELDRLYDMVEGLRKEMHENHDKLTVKLDALSISHAVHKTKSAVWGVLGGGIATLIGAPILLRILTFVLLKH